MKKTIITIGTLLSGVLLSASVTAGGNVARGKEKAQACFACHGEGGNQPISNYPKLAGQYADYLKQSLKAYQNGKRKNAVMVGSAAGLSADDIDDLVAYFSSQPGDLQ